MGAGVVVASGLIAWLFPEWHIPIWAALPVLVVVVGGVAHPMLDGTYHLWVADEAEGWTASELRKLKRDGWGVVGRVPFQYNDVDHVAVHLRSVYAIDTKHTDSELDLLSKWDRPIVEQWANKAEDASRSLRLLLTHAQHLDVEVIPVVAVWGLEVTAAPQMVNGVLVLKAKHLRDELRSRGSGEAAVSEEQARVVDVLEDFRSMRAAHQRAARRGLGRYGLGRARTR